MEHLNWGLPVALDLFLAGLGAGAFMLAVGAQLANDRKYRAVSLTGALIAPWPVILGVLLLVIDLGRPTRFWEMLLRKGDGILMFNINSTMSIGTWLLTAFVILSLVHIVVSLATIPFKWGKIARAVSGLVGLPVALMVSTYTGVLLSAARSELWSIPVLPMVFVPSAIASGVAAVIFILALGRVIEPATPGESNIPGLERLTGGVLIFQLVAMIIFMALGLGMPAMKTMIGPGYGLLWWVGIIGLGVIVPLVAGYAPKARSAQISLVVSALVLLGGFFLRYAILVVGQAA